MRRFRIFARLATISVHVSRSRLHSPGPADGQTNTQTDQAQQQNVAVDCSTITSIRRSRRPVCRRRARTLRPRRALRPRARSSLPARAFQAELRHGPAVGRPQLAGDRAARVRQRRRRAERASAVRRSRQFAGRRGTGRRVRHRPVVRQLPRPRQPAHAGPRQRQALHQLEHREHLRATGAGEQVDLGQINTKLIDRIETIAIGGAPIYGSDAIAGTINIILKHDYEGIDVDAQDGILAARRCAQLSPARPDRPQLPRRPGEPTASAEYNKGKGFTWSDRASFATRSSTSDRNPTSQFSQCLYPNGPRVNATVIGGAPLVGDRHPAQSRADGSARRLAGLLLILGARRGGGTAVQFDPNGNLTADRLRR